MVIRLNDSRITVAIVVAMLLALAGILFAMGRIPYCVCGLHLWTLDAWGSASSQHVADPYSSSHFLHGILFFALLSFVASTISLRLRMMISLVLEIGWELLENSPLIIERYRSATASLGYNGDSIVNSVSDVLFMLCGFWIASRVPWKWSLFLVLAVELGMLWLYRDNLTLNVIMLLMPIDAIRQWQVQV